MPEVFANDKEVALNTTQHDLILPVLDSGEQSDAGASTSDRAKDDLAAVKH